ncbi:MAG: Holliday junction resolvase RecU, partial [Erysipelotrichaceae bacterium]|nr:Holliday junction resolvase RecU [Erysipelotrichaceae bacterium]
YRGKYIDFEAKECASRTSFPLQLIHEHQLSHLANVTSQGGIAFIIVRFTYYYQCFLVMEEKVNSFRKESRRKSIPYTWFLENGYQIPYNYVIPVDYLSIIRELYFKTEETK